MFGNAYTYVDTEIATDIAEDTTAADIGAATTEDVVAEADAAIVEDNMPTTAKEIEQDAKSSAHGRFKIMW